MNTDIFLYSSSWHPPMEMPDNLPSQDNDVQYMSMNLNSLHWRHNLLNRLLGRRSEKTSKLRVTGLCVGNSPGPVNFPHKGPVTRKMFPFDDVIMCNYIEYKHFLKPTAIKVKAWASNYNPDKRTHVILIHPFPDCKVHGSNMGPIWGRQDPGGPHVGPMNFAIWVNLKLTMLLKRSQKYSIISTGLHTWQIRILKVLITYGKIAETSSKHRQFIT